MGGISSGEGRPHGRFHLVRRSILDQLAPVMKRQNRLLLFALGVAAALAGCATDSDRPALRTGMTRDDLRAWFGAPVRIEAAPGGEEVWYYRFAYWTPPEVGGTTYQDRLNEVDTVSVSISTSRGTQERPIHLSSDGRVVDPVPEGKIVKK